MIDVRDSYFQADPFDPILDPDEKAFLVFHGVETILISQCGWNGGWVKDCFGKKILDDIGNNHIICSGVSLGVSNLITYSLTHSLTHSLTQSLTHSLIFLMSFLQ